MWTFLFSILCVVVIVILVNALIHCYTSKGSSSTKSEEDVQPTDGVDAVPVIQALLEPSVPDIATFPNSSPVVEIAPPLASITEAVETIIVSAPPRVSQSFNVTPRCPSDVYSDPGAYEYSKYGCKTEWQRVGYVVTDDPTVRPQSKTMTVFARRNCNNRSVWFYRCVDGNDVSIDLDFGHDEAYSQGIRWQRNGDYLDHSWVRRNLHAEPVLSLEIRGSCDARRFARQN